MKKKPFPTPSLMEWRRIREHFAYQSTPYTLGRTGAVNEMLKSAGLFGANKSITKSKVTKSTSLCGLNKISEPTNSLTKSCSLPTLTGR